MPKQTAQGKPQPAATERALLVPLLVGVTFGAVAALLLQQALKGDSKQARGGPASESLVAHEAQGSKSPLKRTPFKFQELPLFVAPEDQKKECIAVDKVATSDWLLEGILNSVRVSFNFKKGNPAASAQDAHDYVRGVAQTLRAIGPDLFEPMGNALMKQLCESKNEPDELVLMGFLQQELPELVRPQGVDCVLAQHSAEGPVAWSMLEAWQTSGMPETQEIAKHKAEWTDSRTTDRLMPLAERQRRTRELFKELAAQRKGRASSVSEPGSAAAGSTPSAPPISASAASPKPMVLSN